MLQVLSALLDAVSSSEAGSTTCTIASLFLIVLQPLHVLTLASVLARRPAAMLPPLPPQAPAQQQLQQAKQIQQQQQQQQQPQVQQPQLLPCVMRRFHISTDAAVEAQTVMWRDASHLHRLPPTLA